MNNTRARALEHGGTLVLALKFLFAIALAGLAISDKNTRFLTENPGKVIGEAIVVGAGSVLAFLFIAWNRQVPTSAWPKLAIVAFGVFFGVHFLLELSGFNQVEESTASKKLSETTSRASKSIIGKLLVGLVLVLLLLFTACGWDSPAEQMGGWRIPGWKGFGVEGFVFALSSALPFIMIVKDRKGSTEEAFKEFIKYFFLFGLGHVGLQYGGLYREAGFMRA